MGGGHYPGQPTWILRGGIGEDLGMVRDALGIPGIENALGYGKEMGREGKHGKDTVAKEIGTELTVWEYGLEEMKNDDSKAKTHTDGKKMKCAATPATEKCRHFHQDSYITQPISTHYVEYDHCHLAAHHFFKESKDFSEEYVNSELNLVPGPASVNRHRMNFLEQLVADYVRARGRGVGGKSTYGKTVTNTGAHDTNGTATDNSFVYGFSAGVYKDRARPKRRRDARTGKRVEYKQQESKRHEDATMSKGSEGSVSTEGISTSTGSTSTSTGSTSTSTGSTTPSPLQPPTRYIPPPPLKRQLPRPSSIGSGFSENPVVYEVGEHDAWVMFFCFPATRTSFALEFTNAPEIVEKEKMVVEVEREKEKMGGGGVGSDGVGLGSGIFVDSSIGSIAIFDTDMHKDVAGENDNEQGGGKRLKNGETIGVGLSTGSGGLEKHSDSSPLTDSVPADPSPLTDHTMEDIQEETETTSNGVATSFMELGNHPPLAPFMSKPVSVGAPQGLAQSSTETDTPTILSHHPTIAPAPSSIPSTDPAPKPPKKRSRPTKASKSTLTASSIWHHIPKVRTINAMKHKWFSGQDMLFSNDMCHGEKVDPCWYFYHEILKGEREGKAMADFRKVVRDGDVGWRDVGWSDSDVDGYNVSGISGITEARFEEECGYLIRELGKRKGRKNVEIKSSEVKSVVIKTVEEEIDGSKEQGMGKQSSEEMDFDEDSESDFYDDEDDGDVIEVEESSNDEVSDSDDVDPIHGDYFHNDVVKVDDKANTFSDMKWNFNAKTQHLDLTAPVNTVRMPKHLHPNYHNSTGHGVTAPIPSNPLPHMPLVPFDAPVVSHPRGQLVAPTPPTVAEKGFPLYAEVDNEPVHRYGGGDVHSMKNSPLNLALADPRAQAALTSTLHKTKQERDLGESLGGMTELQARVLSAGWMRAAKIEKDHKAESQAMEVEGAGKEEHGSSSNGPSSSSTNGSGASGSSTNGNVDPKGNVGHAQDDEPLYLKFLRKKKEEGMAPPFPRGKRLL